MHSSLSRPARAVSSLVIVVAAAALAACSAVGPDDSIDVDDPRAGVRVIGAVGDSFTAGMNACGDVGDCVEASWAVGTDPAVESVATRIEGLSGERPEVVSAALSGGDLSDSLASLDTVIDAGPDLVTILIGGNDACAPSVDTMTSEGEFADGFALLVDRLSSELPQAQLLALSIPTFETYWNLADAEPRALALWTRYDFCPSALSGTHGDGAEANRAAVSERVAAYNAAIQDVCRAVSRCIDDDGELGEHLFTVAELSEIDYMHPSPAGQHVISDIAWRALSRAS